MVTCDLCWDGRHARCGGRNNCLCGVCSGKDRPKHHVRQEQQARKPRLAIPNPYRGAVPFETAPLTRQFTTEDVTVCLEVLRNLGTLFEVERVRRNIPYETVGTESGVSEQSIRKLIRGKLPQGLTQRSLEALLVWLEGSGGVAPQDQWQARTDDSGGQL